MPFIEANKTFFSESESPTLSTGQTYNMELLFANNSIADVCTRSTIRL